jgi:hypothetical protein
MVFLSNAGQPGRFTTIGGLFTDKPFPPGFTYSAAYGDLDGDGRVDIVDQNLRIYLNNTRLRP